MRKKYKLEYTILIVIMNESLLAIYNSLLKTEGFLTDHLQEAMLELIPAILFGVVVEYLLLSKIIKKLSLEMKKTGHITTKSKYFDEVLLSIGMSLVVTIYGTFLHAGNHSVDWGLFVEHFLLNIIFAVPVFIFIIHPIAVKIMLKLHEVHL